MPLPLPAGATLRPDYEAMYTTHTAYPAAGARLYRPLSTCRPLSRPLSNNWRSQVPARAPIYLYLGPDLAPI
jgi:hypothetical protein